MLKGEESTLNKLAHETMNVDSPEPTGWLVAAMLCCLKGDNEKALVFVDKAIRTNSNCSRAHLLKGKLLLEREPQSAFVAYVQANFLHSDASSYIGMIEASLSMGDVKQALRTAQEAQKALPQSPGVCVAMAKVLTRRKGGLEESIRLFNKAIKLEPLNVGYVTALVDVLLEMERKDDAVSCLR
jgi:tetratricopeptide (TPR) repeat protein